MIALIDYGAGNLQSVRNALKTIKQECYVAKTPCELVRAQKIILPGVGAAGSAMQQLLETGLIDALSQWQKPLLGICLGLQLLAAFSEESDTLCLNRIPGRVKRLPGELKVPHIGWNKVRFCKPSPLFAGIPDESFFYFVHSFYCDAPQGAIAGRTRYGLSFASAIQDQNLYGVQFHPEKSGDLGLRVLRNFCEQC